MGHDRIADGWHILVSHFTSNISSDGTITAWTLEERRKNLPLPRHIWKHWDCHPDHAGRQPTMYLQLCDPESLVLAPRKFGRRNGKSTSTPEQLTLITQKAAEHITSSSDSLLSLTANRETLTHRDSEQAEFARTVEIGHLNIANEPVIDENSSSPLCR